MTDDPHDGYVLLGAIVSWSYHNGSWTELSYNASSNQTYLGPHIGAMAYDAADQYVVGFGRTGNDYPYRGGDANNFTWKWWNGTWINITANVSGAPPARYSDGSLAYDSADNYIVLYGGFDFTCLQWAGGSCSQGITTFLADTWTFSQSVWTNVTPSTSPGFRQGPGLVDNPGDGGMLLYGGSTCPESLCPGGPIGTTFVNWTWFWGSAPPISGLAVNASRSPVDLGVQLQLAASLSGGTAPIAFGWNFGDGTFANGSVVNHTYLAAGTFSPRVWANDSAGGSATASTSVVVNSGLNARPTASPNPTDIGLLVSFSSGQSNGTSPYAYSWDFGDGTRASAGNPMHAYGASGTYTPHLWLNDSGGDSVVGSVVIMVNPGLKIIQLNATPNPADLGQPVNFTATVSGGTGGYAYSWAFGDGGTGGNLRNITHIYTTNGPFVASLVVTDVAGQSASSSLNITIALNALIFANASLGAVPLWTGFTAKIQGGIPGYTYVWQLGDGTSSALASPSHLYTTPGEFEITLRVTDVAGHVAGANWTLLVFPGGGSLTMFVSVYNETIPIGGSTSLVAQPQGGSGRYLFSWTSVPTACSSVGILKLVCAPADNGTYSAVAMVVDGSGDNASATGVFTVGPSAVPPSKGATLFGLTGLEGYLILGVVIAALLGLSALAISAVRRPRRPRPLHDDGTGRLYASYKPENTGHVEQGTADPSDSLSDIF